MNDSRDLWLSRWMNEYGDRLLQIVGGYTHDYEAAQDIVQKVFVRLYRGHQKTAPNTLHAGWLYTVARRLAIDFHRRRPPAPVASIPEATTDGSHDLTVEVENVLDELSNLDREMLTLFYYQEWTVA